MDQVQIDERHDRVIDLVDTFRRKHGSEETLHRLNRFMIAYLSLTKNSLPDVAARALAVAERFNTDVSLGNEVQRARRDCWDSLKSIGAMFDFESRDSRSIRAALCTLETDRTTADVSELAEWFLTFADGVEDHSSELWDLAKTAFS